LEFYIHIYFAIYPALAESGQNERDLKRELTAFKVFLDTKGSELSQTSEFLPYYALPYVQNPVDHPHFSNLCSRKWASPGMSSGSHHDPALISIAHAPLDVE
jgi:hypothetical protein